MTWSCRNGWQGRDEMGGADLADLVNIVPQVARIEGADASRVYLSGESRGGMMVVAPIATPRPSTGFGALVAADVSVRSPRNAFGWNLNSRRR